MVKDLNSSPDAGKEAISTDGKGMSSTPREKTSSIASLRLPNFRYLLTGSILSSAIQWIQTTALNWLVYDLTGSGTLLGTFNLVSSAATLCMLFVTGLMVDRFNRHRLLKIETCSMFILTLVLGLALFTHHTKISYLYVYTFLCGLILTIDSTLRQVLVFDMVPRSQTPGAVTLIQTGWSLMRVLGPTIGGFLLLWFGAGGTFLVQAGIYALIIITVLRMKLPEREADTVQVSPIQNLREGIGYVIKEPVVRIFALINIVLMVLIVPIFSILPAIYAVRVFHDSSGTVLGFLMASVGIGGILGGVTTTYLRRFEHWGTIQLAALLIVCLMLIAFALSSTLPVALLFLALSGFFEMIFLTTNQTLIQLAIPNNIRGRVTAATSLIFILGTLGSILGGAGADLVGAKMTTIIFAGAAAVITIFTFMISSTVRNYRLSKGITFTSTK